MAGNRFKVKISPTATGTSALTLLQLIAASNHKVLVDYISIAFAGISNTAAPIQVDILKQTTAGTGSGTTNSTIVKDGDWDETVQTTRLDTFSGEPTASDVLYTLYVHPQGGLEITLPRGKEIQIPGGGRLGVRVTAGASVNAIVTIGGEE